MKLVLKSLTLRVNVTCRLRSIQQSLSPRLSLTPRNYAQRAMTCRNLDRWAAGREILDNSSGARHESEELKILVSAVQSRPCPPFSFPAFRRGCGSRSFSDGSSDSVDFDQTHERPLEADVPERLALGGVQRAQLCCGLAQDALVGDRVPAIDRLRLVADGREPDSRGARAWPATDVLRAADSRSTWSSATATVAIT